MYSGFSCGIYIYIYIIYNIGTDIWMRLETFDHPKNV